MPPSCSASPSSCRFSKFLPFPVPPFSLLTSLLVPLTFVALLASCATDSTFQPDPNRHPLGKADGIGSCEGFCDGKSDGACWCDEWCSYYGDCCTDKVAVCDGPKEELCGGWLGDTCDSDEYCQFEESAICGFADASGVCMPRPEACIEIFMPVCGCDGQTYANSCHANAAGVSVSSLGACEVPPPFCGGFGNFQCPDGLQCIDDPNDDCEPQNGGADCGGICVSPEDCEPVLCELFCQNGFALDEDGCEICVCKPSNPPINSCEGSCGGQSDSGACWCDDACVGYGDCCEDVDDQCAESERIPASGICIKNSEDECQSDADCIGGGCGGELCFNPAQSDGISTCECMAPVQVSGCGCVAGSCTWYNE